MGRKPTADEKRLGYRLTTHVTEYRYKQLEALLRSSGRSDMSTLIRNILENRPIKIYVHDETIDLWLHELSRIRSEIKAIGVNVNQITKHFNTYPEPIRKANYAKMAFDEYQKLQTPIMQIFAIINKIADKWLSASTLENQSAGRSATTKES